MKKMIVFFLFAVTVTLFSVDSLLAEKKKDPSVNVLSETSFVVVQGRGADDASVILYQVYDGKLQLVDALLVDGDFTDISRPTIRVLRPTQYSPRK